MKKIIISESQFKRLLENGISSAPDFNGGDIKEFPGSEVSATANVTDSNGELEYGKPTNADKIQSQMAIQNFWANGNHQAKQIR